MKAIFACFLFYCLVVSVVSQRTIDYDDKCWTKAEGVSGNLTDKCTAYTDCCRSQAANCMASCTTWEGTLYRQCICSLPQVCTDCVKPVSYDAECQAATNLQTCGELKCQDYYTCCSNRTGSSTTASPMCYKDPSTNKLVTSCSTWIADPECSNSWAQGGKLYDPMSG